MVEAVDSSKESTDSLYSVDRFVNVDSKDVNLKFVFDHLRNYGICGLMLYVAMRLFMRSQASPASVEYIMDLVACGVLFSVTVVLFGLNFVQGMNAAAAVGATSKSSKTLVVFLMFAMFIAAYKLMFGSGGDL